jgi:hypothetical protein
MTTLVSHSISNLFYGAAGTVQTADCQVHTVRAHTVCASLAPAYLLSTPLFVYNVADMYLCTDDEVMAQFKGETKKAYDRSWRQFKDKNADT